MRGQSLVDYATLMAAVCFVLAGTAVYTKRAVQGRLKAGTDSLGEQFSPRWSNYAYTTTMHTRQSATQFTNGLRVSKEEDNAVSRLSDPYVDDFSNTRLTDERLGD